MQTVAFVRSPPDVNHPSVVVTGRQCLVNPGGRTRIALHDCRVGVDVEIRDRPPKKRPRPPIENFHVRPGSPAVDDGFAPAILYGLCLAWNANLLASKLFKGTGMMLVAPRPNRQQTGYWLCRVDSRGITPVIGVILQLRLRYEVQMPSGRRYDRAIPEHWLLEMYGRVKPQTFASSLDATTRAIESLIAEGVLR